MTAPLDTVPDIDAPPPEVDTWPRSATLAGLAFAVLYVLGLFLSGDRPAYDAADEDWVAWFDDGGNRALALLGAFALVAASMAFLVFLAQLVQRLRTVASPAGAAPLVVLAAGIVFAGSTAIAAIGINQVAAAIAFGGDGYPIPDADVIRQSEQLGFGVGLVVGGWSAALVLAATSVCARRSGVLPAWLATSGLVAAAVLVVSSAFFLPLLLVAAWSVAVSLTIRSSHRRIP